MLTISGSIILNGVTDKQMEAIWGHKARHGGAFGFTPNVMQTAITPQGNIYNNVTFTYPTVHGLNLVAEIVNLLTKEETKVVGL